MRKKLVTLLLAASMVLSLSACGDNVDEEVVVDTIVSSGTVEDTEESAAVEDVVGTDVSVESVEVSEDEFWVSKDDIELPIFGTLAVSEKSALNGTVSYKISSTPFEFDVDAVESVVKSNKLVNGGI